MAILPSAVKSIKYYLPGIDSNRLTIWHIDHEKNKGFYLFNESKRLPNGNRNKNIKEVNLS